MTMAVDREAGEEICPQYVSAHAYTYPTLHTHLVYFKSDIRVSWKVIYFEFYIFFLGSAGQVCLDLQKKKKCFEGSITPKMN